MRQTEKRKVEASVFFSVSSLEEAAVISRCNSLLAAVALVALFAVTREVLASPAGNDLVIVEKGKAQAVIVHGPDSKGSAGLLRGYIQASTKAKLPIVAEKDATKGARIHVGLTELVKKAGLPS